MIKKVQVLWYLNKEDLENYCIDFKEYKSHKLEGYEICDVDEDLIFDLCDVDCDRIEPIGYFKNKKEIENHIADYITNNEYELNPPVKLLFIFITRKYLLITNNKGLISSYFIKLELI